MFPILVGFVLWRMLKTDSDYVVDENNRIPSDFVVAILKNKLGITDNDIWLTDGWYIPVPRSVAERFMASYTVYKAWTENKWDCDNDALDAYVMFERKCMGSAFGFLKYEAEPSGHQLNYFIDPSGKLLFMDIRSKTISETVESKKNIKCYI